MDLEFLTWDSDFFGFRIGRVKLQTEDCLWELKDKEINLQENFDLLYLLCTSQKLLDETEQLCLVDKKIIYRKTFHTKPDLLQNICLFDLAFPTSDLYDLALISGVYSRYRIDYRFPPGSFERLYHHWIEEAVSGTMADAVFCYQEQGHIVGMVTLQVKNKIGYIGLISVCDFCQNRGIGTALMIACENYLFDRGISTLEVATQLNNKKACYYYEKNGFVKKEVINIYHWWTGRQL